MLWDALKRSYLVEPPKYDLLITNSNDETPTEARTPLNRFTLDMVIEDEGGNLSVGQVRRIFSNAGGFIIIHVTFFRFLSYSNPCFHCLAHSLRMPRLSSLMKRQVRSIYISRSHFLANSITPSLSVCRL
jgi:hypothetical protein